METQTEIMFVLGSLDRPDKIEQLDKLLKVTQKNSDRDVVIDLSDVTINSVVIAKLLEIYRILKGAGRELILCGVDTQAKGVFTITALDKVFHLVEDRSSAMNLLEKMRQERHAEAT